MTRWNVTAIACLAGAVVLAACGADPAPFALPTITASPLTDEASPAGTGQSSSATPGAASPSPTTSPSASPTDAEPSASEGDSGPSTGDRASAVAAQVERFGASAESAVVDLDGDDVPEVLVAAVEGGVGVVTVSWWSPDDGYRQLVERSGGPGDEVVSLRVTDLVPIGVREVIVEVAAGERGSLALFSVSGRGELDPVRVVGGCHDGSHVLGVTGATLVTRGAGAPPAVVASCDDSPLPPAQWSDDTYEWRDGAYRFVPPAPPPTDDDSPAPGADDGESVARG